MTLSRVLIRKKKVNTKNCNTKSQINTLPVGWGIRKIHTKINFKWPIISEESWFPQNEYIIKRDKGIIATLNEEVGATSVDILLN